MTAKILQWWLMMALLGFFKATLDCVRAFSDTDFRHDMGTFRVPTPVSHGTSDAIVPAEKSGRIAAKMIQGVELLKYPGTLHGLFFTDKDRLNQHLLTFIQR